MLAKVRISVFSSFSKIGYDGLNSWGVAGGGKILRRMQTGGAEWMERRNSLSWWRGADSWVSLQAERTGVSGGLGGLT